MTSRREKTSCFSLWEINLIFRPFWDVTFSVTASATSRQPPGTSPTVSPHDLILDLDLPRVALRPRVKVRQRCPPLLHLLLRRQRCPQRCPTRRPPAARSPVTSHPAATHLLPQGPPGSSHPAGRSPSNIRVSHNTEAVLRATGLGAVGKHGCCSFTSNPSTPARSGGVGANKFTVSGSPRSLRAERKAKADKLQGLLYQHPDLLADFKSSVGGDFKPHRVLTVVKFRDLLKTFEEKPSGQLRDKLRKMAVSLHNSGTRRLLVPLKVG